MKTEDQITRFVCTCQFSDSDWKEVLQYCKTNFKGGVAHRAKAPKASCTYEEFLEWVEEGIGAGDFVSYGNTFGIAGDSYPGQISLAMYLDYDRNPIQKTLEVKDPERVVLLDDERAKELKELLMENKLAYHVRLGVMGERYMPSPGTYITLDEAIYGKNVGLYVGEGDPKGNLAAFLSNNVLQFNCNIVLSDIYVKKASLTDVRKLHSAATNGGFTFNERAMRFVKVVRRGLNNVYWYLNEMFEIATDHDNGGKRHEMRFKAGNYFTDNTDARVFMMQVKKLREE